MKLLFDENVSPKLTNRLASEYPGSVHVRDVGLRGGEDRQVWDYARTHGFVITSKDTDFRDRSYVEGAPPKIIWLDVGNAGTDAIVKLLQGQVDRVTRLPSLVTSLVSRIPGAYGQSAPASLAGSSMLRS